ncbi:MAG TPA: hypothetical protein VGG44_00785 [Tepidisphaeraceae bacterium]|jgi:hypothetical protein
MRSIGFLLKIAVIAILVPISGCCSGNWDVTDDPARPETGWTKNQIYQLQTRLFIYQYLDSKNLFLDFPRFAKTNAVPGSTEELHEQRDNMGDDALGVLEKGSLMKFKALRLDHNCEDGDSLIPIGQILTGKFTDRLVYLVNVSGFEFPPAAIQFRSVGQTSFAVVRPRDPKVFLPIQAK